MLTTLAFLQYFFISLWRRCRSPATFKPSSFLTVDLCNDLVISFYLIYLHDIASSSSSSHWVTRSAAPPDFDERWGVMNSNKALLQSPTSDYKVLVRAFQLVFWRDSQQQKTLALAFAAVFNTVPGAIFQISCYLNKLYPLLVFDFLPSNYLCYIWFLYILLYRCTLLHMDLFIIVAYCCIVVYYCIWILLLLMYTYYLAYYFLVSSCCWFYLYIL